MLKLIDAQAILSVSKVAAALGISYRRAYRLLRLDAAHLCGKIGQQRFVYGSDLPQLRKLAAMRLARTGKRGKARNPKGVRT